LKAGAGVSTGKVLDNNVQTFCNSASSRIARIASAHRGITCHTGSLNARLREDVLVTFLRLAVVDFDRAFEIRAVFDHDLCCRQICNHRTVLHDLDSALRIYSPLHVAADNHVAGADVSRLALLMHFTQGAAVLVCISRCVESHGPDEHPGGPSARWPEAKLQLSAAQGSPDIL
jgi:hypothetical protein